MPDAPYVTGNDLLAYKGNADLGYGGQGGAAYTYNPAVQDPLAPLNQSLQHSLDQTTQFNEMVYQNAQQQKRMEYQEGARKQEQMFDYLSKTGQSLFNQKDGNGNDMSLAPIPEDQKYLQDKLAGVTKGLTGNSAGYQYDPKIMGTANEVMSLGKVAQARKYKLATAQQQLAQAQASGDTDEQKRISDYIKSEITDHPLSEGAYIPKTLAPAPALSWDSFHDAKTLNDPKNREDYGGFSGRRPDIVDNRDELRADKTKMFQANNWVKQQIPAYINAPEMIKEVDNHNALVNQQRHFQPGDHYIPSFEEALKSGDPANMIYALHGAKMLELSASDEAAKKSLELKNLQADADKKREEIKKIRADKGKTPEEKKFQLERKEAGLAATGYIGEAMKIGVDAKALMEKEKADFAANPNKTKQYAGLSPEDLHSVANKPDLAAALDQQGIDYKGYSAVQTPLTQRLINDAPYIAQPGVSGGATESKATPKNAYVLLPPDGDVKNAKVVYQYAKVAPVDVGGKYIIKDTGQKQYSVASLKDLTENRAGTDKLLKEKLSKAWDSGGKVEDDEEDTKPSTKSTTSTGEDAIARRLITTTAIMNGKEVPIKLDPVTNKRYAIN